MKEFSLKAKVRTEQGKKACSKMRKQNFIPAVIYGGKEVKHLVIKYDDVRNLVYSPDIFLINLDLDGTAVRAIMKDIQFHPVTDRILHMDFLEVFPDKPVVMDVPVVLKGHSIGVKAGGKLVTIMRKIRVKALYSQIPEVLDINVEKLAIGKAYKVGDLSFENLELISSKNSVVCAVRTARGVKVALDETEEEGAETAESTEATAE